MDRRMNRFRTRRRYAPLFEGLEVREVPSTTAMIATSALLTTRPAASTGGGGSGDSLPLLYRPFTAKFNGPFVTGQGRAVGQLSQTYTFSGGISSAFLHGDLQLAFSTPSDPAQPIVGQAVMTVKNVSNTGNQLIVDLTAVPGQVDRRGRPTLFNWTQNDASGGVFTNGSGSGTVRLLYFAGKFPGQSHLRKILDAGKVGVSFQGTIGTTNLNSTLRNQ